MEILPNTGYSDPRRLPLLQRRERSLDLEVVAVDAWAFLRGVTSASLKESFLILLIVCLLQSTIAPRLCEALIKPGKSVQDMLRVVCIVVIS